MKKRPAKSARGAQRSLTRARVVAEARLLLDEHGPDALSMRTLADRLDVSPMALYNHVENRQDLIRGVADAVVDEFRIPAAKGDWRRRLRSCFRALRKTCLANPKAIPLIETADTLHSAVFRPMEYTLEALQEAGLDLHDALKAYFVLIGFMMQQVSYEIRGPFGGLDPGIAARRGAIPPDEFPLTLQAAPSQAWDFDAAFEFGLDVIIEGLAQRASSPAARRGKRKSSSRSQKVTRRG
jgi:TetR/AcrR family tetracycline transcriptional repressor